MQFPIPGTHKILGDSDIFFIAEIGKNFIQTEDDRPVAEYLENAKKLVKAAKDAGADAAKFQTHEVEDEVLNIDFTSPHFKAKNRYSWVSRNMNATPFEEFWKPLKKYCDEIGILFFTSPMSRKAAQKIDSLVPLWKVGSGDVEDHVMLNYLAATKKPIIISTGMVSLGELDAVVDYFADKNVPLTILYCVSQYPAPKEAFNLATIEELREKYPNAVIGFSDHSLTHDATLAALKMGAKVIEKHFSFSRELWGADHKASLTPGEFKEMVDLVRNGSHMSVDIGAMYGVQGKELEGATNQFRPYFNKALMIGVDLLAGTTLTEEMVFAMRPLKLAGGLPANKLSDIIGRRIAKNLKKYDPITDGIFS